MSTEETWHSLSAQEIAARLGVQPASGLSTQEARRRLEQYGPNRLRERKRISFWGVFAEEVREPMILLLLITGVLYSVWGKLSDALTIFVVILTLVSVEVWNEWRAKRTIAALGELAELTAPLRRAGRTVEVPVEEVVPGDILLVEAGRRIPADARLLEAYGLAVDESTLTGESVPVEKNADQAVPTSAPLAERSDMVFAGTTVTRGRGTGVIVATGMSTELGRIAGLTAEVRAPRTPLQLAMRQLSGYLVWLALTFSILVPLLGFFVAHQDLQQMVLTGLSLAFATIPEELPIIITMVLALGAFRLARHNAVAKYLQAVETLGDVTAIATDKTGTLTENRMRVERLYPTEQGRALLELGIMANDAEPSGGDFAGDPLDTALLRAARDEGLDPARYRQEHPLRNEYTFDNIRKRMSVVYQPDSQDLCRVAVKGAPESVLPLCFNEHAGDGIRPLAGDGREQIMQVVAQMAAKGLRVVALADKMVGDCRLGQEEAEAGLNLAGLVAFADPPRPEAAGSIAACRSAGIRPMMVTGDHPLTARAIAAQIGLDGAAPVLTGPELDALSDQELQQRVEQVSIYARTTPEHKLRIVNALHANGERVAVTGDGVNDAPALAAADIGVAMGETGTDVAREAADIVLADDNFQTIVRAIREGRVLFDNLTKGVRYYLAVKVALVSVTLLPVLLGVPVPFAPVQIILMELFMDLAASTTFVAEPPEAGLMQRPPRDPRAPFMSRAMVTSILASAAGLFAAVTAAYLYTWYHNIGLPGADPAAVTTYAQTMAFVTWLLGHVFLAVNLRSQGVSLLRLGLFSNRLMIWWALATVAFLLVVTLVPGLRGVFRVTVLSARDWGIALGLAVVGTFWIEGWKWIRGGR